MRSIMQWTEMQLKSKIGSFIEKNSSKIVEDIGRLVAQRSVEDFSTAAQGAPFGQGPRRALDTALQIATEMELETHDGDGYVGWAQLQGKEEGHLATITHVDVVPEGEGWTGDPYIMREREGWIIGRGVADDKGPSVLCLYLAKFYKELMQEGYEMRYGLRVLLGCSEETGMNDVPYYLERNPQPLFCFSPDAEFPVCYGEKGHLNGAFVAEGLSGNLVEFAGGIANNVVPDRATCLVKYAGEMPAGTDRITVEQEGDCLRLRAVGVGAHAAFPQGGVNAIALLVDYLLQNELCTEKEAAFLRLLKTLHDATDGSGLGIACRDEVFDPLTIVGGVIELKDGCLRQYVDSRYPTAITAEEIQKKCSALAAQAGGKFEVARAEKPFYLPPETPAIQVLLQTYNEVSGRDEKPFTMGGGTYARCFANAASYGPERLDAVKPDFAGNMHGADEATNVQELLDALKIYILAIYRLQKLDF